MQGENAANTFLWTYHGRRVRDCYVSGVTQCRKLWMMRHPGVIPERAKFGFYDRDLALLLRCTNRA